MEFKNIACVVSCVADGICQDQILSLCSFSFCFTDLVGSSL